jgi:metal-responsive CopG/Arc/MetJ family transcriptional regulator
MRVKTSITLSPDTLRAVDQLVAEHETRSEVIERAVLDFLARRRQADRDARELARIDRDADVLNRELAATLEFQVDLFEAG